MSLSKPLAHELEQQLSSVPAGKQAASPSIEIPVCYGGEFGPELESIGDVLGLTPDALIEMHTSREHIVELVGFTPGFAYVAGVSEDANVPRLAEPRQRVEPGSVGIAGGLDRHVRVGRSRWLAGCWAERR